MSRTCNYTAVLDGVNFTNMSEPDFMSSKAPNRITRSKSKAELQIVNKLLQQISNESSNVPGELDDEHSFLSEIDVENYSFKDDISPLDHKVDELDNHCMPFCRYLGESGDKMVCCCLCQRWHHYECVNIKKDKDIPVIWNCPLCRSVVREISDKTVRLENVIDQQTLMITELLRIIRKFDANDELTKLATIGPTKTGVTPTSQKSNNLPDLLIGSSIIKETASKDKMFHIRSRRGAKVNDITNMLATMKENTYSTVTVLVGANNCSTTENSDIEDILASYDKLLTEANRVAALTVRISSLCPRTRNVVEDRKIKDVNVRLKQKAVQKGYKFIDNDTNFRFQDGNADSSVLQSDGVHLNSKGVERLISNLGLSKHIFYRKIGNIKKTNNSFSQTATTSPVVKVPQSALQYVQGQPTTHFTIAPVTFQLSPTYSYPDDFAISASSVGNPPLSGVVPEPIHPEET